MTGADGQRLPVCHTMSSRILLRLLRLALALLLALAGVRAAAEPVAPLQLGTAAAVVDAWPAATLLVDAAGTLTPEQALASRDRFVRPAAPHANLGVKREPVWLRVPVHVAAGDPGQWVFSVEYASIDRVDLHVVTGGRIVRRVTLGRTLPFSERPMPSAFHAVPLTFEPGQDHELLLRVETLSSMVLPIAFATPAAFHAREAGAQAMQGVAAGLGLCLILYSLTQWVSLRDTMFLQYALVTVGGTLFFVAYYGLGPQHLWGDNAWLTLHAAPLAVLVGLVGSFLFVERVLAVHELQPGVARLMRAGSIAAALTALLFATGLLGYRATQATATVIGPLPMLLAIPIAWQRARRGERVGAYMLVGWGVYAIATLTMAALLRGWVPSTFWTQHAFQFGSLFEMVLWMRVLAVRVEEMRAQAQRAHLERDALHALAHTDALTGLPNRRGLQHALDAALPGCTPLSALAVFLLDLDGFKPVNDRLGHDAGDELLVLVARRLRGLVRSGDLVARLGGDEFVVVVGSIPGDAEARAVGQKMLDQFLRPFEVAGQTCRVGLTIGYALAPQDGRDAASLLKRADAAMYAGKQAGRHCLKRGGASLAMAGT